MSSTAKSFPPVAVFRFTIQISMDVFAPTLNVVVKFCQLQTAPEALKTFPIGSPFIENCKMGGAALTTAVIQADKV